MAALLKSLRSALPPQWRGLFFYAAFFGTLALFDPYLNIYFTELGLNGKEVGVISMLAPLAMLLISPFISASADRMGKRAVTLALVLLITGVGFALLGFARTFIMLLPAMALLAVVRAPAVALGDGLVARMAVNRQLDFGSMRLGGSIGFFVLCILGGLGWNAFGYRVMFPVVAIGFTVAALSGWLLEETPGSGRPFQIPWALIKSDGFLTLLLVAGILMGGAFSMVLIYQGMYITDMGGDQTLVGIVVAASALTELPMMRSAGRLIRRWGGIPALLLGYTIMAISIGGFALASQPWMLLVFSLLRGPGVALMMVGTVTILDRRAGEDHSATVQSLNSAGAFGLAPLISSPLGGWLWDAASPRAVFWVSMGLMVLAGLVLVICWKTQRE